MITTELIRVASDRFGDGGQFNLESLRYWGQLWFLLGAINEAEQNALAIIKFGLRRHDRVDNILILKLLALVACKQETKLVTSDYIKSLYNQLWPTYNTPSEERVDRQQIENFVRTIRVPHSLTDNEILMWYTINQAFQMEGNILSKLRESLTISERLKCSEDTIESAWSALVSV